jgi:hypothetical protein
MIMAISDVFQQLLNELNAIIPDNIAADMPITTEHWSRNVAALKKTAELFGYINDNSLAPPVGSTYMQLPDQPAPDELWPLAEWANVSDAWAGCFFRVEGGLALPFGGGKQDHQLADHSHSYSKPRFGQGDSSANEEIVDYIDSSQTGAVGGNETRPDNYTVRVWKRTA